MFSSTVFCVCLVGMASIAGRAPVQKVIRYFEDAEFSEPLPVDAPGGPTSPRPAAPRPHDEATPGPVEAPVEYGYTQTIEESREVAEILEVLHTLSMKASRKGPAPEPPVLPGTPMPTDQGSVATVVQVVHDNAKPSTSHNDLRLSPLHYDALDPHAEPSQISPKSVLKSSPSGDRTQKNSQDLRRTSFSECMRDHSNRSSQNSNESSPYDFGSPSRWTSEADEFSLGSSNPSYAATSSRRSRQALLNYAVFWGFAVAQMVVAIVLFAVGAVDLILKHGSVDCSSNHYTIYAACIAPGVWAPVLVSTPWLIN